MNTFVPETLQQNVVVLLSALDCHAFDVRSDSGRDFAAAQEIINQGGVKRRPRVFEDNVVYDGRTSVEAVSMLVDAGGKRQTTIAVDVIKGSYSKFTPQKQFEVMAASLGENLPSAKSGFCRFSTEADILHTIRQGIVVAEASLSETVKLLSAEGLSLSRIQKLYRNALNSVTTQRLGLVAAHVKKNDCTPSAAVKALGFPPKMLKDFGDNWKPGHSIGGSKATPKNFITHQQPMLDSALTAIKRYGDVILKAHRDDKMSGISAINVARAHALTAEKIKRYADDMVIRITKEVQSISLGTHRY